MAMPPGETAAPFASRRATPGRPSVQVLRNVWEVTRLTLPMTPADSTRHRLDDRGRVCSYGTDRGPLSAAEGGGGRGARAFSLRRRRRGRFSAEHVEAVIERGKGDIGVGRSGGVVISIEIGAAALRREGGVIVIDARPGSAGAGRGARRAARRSRPRRWRAAARPGAAAPSPAGGPPRAEPEPHGALPLRAARSGGRACSWKAVTSHGAPEADDGAVGEAGFSSRVLHARRANVSSSPDS